MNTSFFRRPAASLAAPLVASTLGLLLAPVHAQWGGSGMRSSRMGNTGNMGSVRNDALQRRDEGIARDTPQAVADRLADLRLRLMISPEQAPQWDAFQRQAMDLASLGGRGRSSTMGPRRDDDALPYRGGLLSLMQQRLTEAQNRYTVIEALADATKALYACLRPDQQGLADAHLQSALPRL